VGYYTARSLYSEGWEVAIVDSDHAAADRAEALDALVVRGTPPPPKNWRRRASRTPRPSSPLTAWTR